MIDRLIETGTCCGMETNVKKAKLMRISRRQSPGQIMRNQEQVRNVEYFKYLGIIIINDARYARENKSRIAMGKVAFFSRVKWTQM